MLMHAPDKFNWGTFNCNIAKGRNRSESSFFQWSNDKRQSIVHGNPQIWDLLFANYQSLNSS